MYAAAAAVGKFRVCEHRKLQSFISFTRVFIRQRHRERNGLVKALRSVKRIHLFDAVKLLLFMVGRTPHELYRAVCGMVIQKVN